MKTTIELPDALAREVKTLAASEGVSMRSIVEMALIREMERRRTLPAWEPRPDLVFHGDGLTEEARSLDWTAIREMSSREPSVAAALERA